ncbi:MAG TPA: hypothetical protein VK797_18860, partial [Tepidisphaeraceae bacterium]|nr:hypothetical protein [Tepidisphaeraceae bacterium]
MKSSRRLRIALLLALASSFPGRIARPDITQIVAQTGQAAGGQTITGIFQAPVVNSAGQVVFQPNLSGNGTTTANVGVFIGVDGQTPPAPTVALQLSGFSGGSQPFTNFSTASLNSSG